VDDMQDPRGWSAGNPVPESKLCFSRRGKVEDSIHCLYSFNGIQYHRPVNIGRLKRDFSNGQYTETAIPDPDQRLVSLTSWMTYEANSQCAPATMGVC
jgi:hypothetical protein